MNVARPVKLNAIDIRPVVEGDIAQLVLLENESFETDRLSLRRMRHWVEASNRVFLVAGQQDEVLAYCLILLHKGTQLARLYSIAVSKKAQGLGLGKKLLLAAEEAASDQGRLYMRLEVAQNNYPAIELYRKIGYVTFGSYRDYYEDHQDALRMQKRIRYIPGNLLSRKTPWYQQTTDFTCGPSSLLMAMAGLDQSIVPKQELELDIWREATTIFMTSGLGGAHPLGLALAATARGFGSEVFLNQKTPLFLEGVRSKHKKDVITVVDRQFHARARREGIKIHYRDISQVQLEKEFNKGMGIVILISTYRMDDKKSPHWVTVTGFDDKCIYVHDPDPSASTQIEIDCEHIPIARSDFDKMSSFGGQRLRTAVMIKKK
ncbi:MAG: GNAT family N-acetyltransferase/peptidase C39 family protein [Pseudomonadales bacterium]|nr:GNAT family N-acetyltransferase/peptidase C39 family protein [Pseudomonadales bacterium]